MMWPHLHISTTFEVKKLEVPNLAGLLNGAWLTIEWQKIVGLFC